ncbi:MAG: tetratricopeptide repeat protein [Betaproteobacteria bacterium]
MSDKRASSEAICAALSATQALEAGDLAAAERDAQNALGGGAHGAQAHFVLGEVARLRGEAAAAERHYRKAIQADARVPYFHHALGSALQDGGRLADAIAAYKRALRLRPSFAEAWNDLGTAQFASRRAADAVECYRRALEHAPHHAVALENLGAALRSTGDLRGALRAFGRQLLGKFRAASRTKADLSNPATWLQRGNRALAGALAEGRQDADALAVKAELARAAGAAVQRERARLLADGGELDEALRVLERIARDENDDASWTALARVRLDRGELAEAEKALQRAGGADALAQLARLRVQERKSGLALEPAEIALAQDGECTEAAYWRGRALIALGRYDEAQETLREWAARRAQDARFPRWLGVALRDQESLEQAEATLRAALKRFPQDFDLQAELLVTLFERGEVASARALLEDLLARHPRHAGAIAAMSLVRNTEGDVEGAADYARRAIAIDPQHAVAHESLGLALLKAGRYEEGWPHYEWRKRVHPAALTHTRFAFPQWESQPLGGRTLLVHGEQGLGDEIMFASCLPDAIRDAGQVIIECEPRLAPLFQRSFPHATVGLRGASPDFQVAIGSLPLRFRRRREDFPAHHGYLSADAKALAQWRDWLESLGTGRKIGVSWRGGLAKTGRVRRSLDLADLAPLLKIPGFRFVSLQYGAVAEDVARLERLHGIRLENRQEAIDDYASTAALVSALDGVLSVCTSIVHLAGALGRPVLVLAPYSPEWRYGMSGETMPWYPSATVLRQPEPGAWQPVLDQAAARLDSKFARDPTTQ